MTHYDHAESQAEENSCGQIERDKAQLSNDLYCHVMLMTDAGLPCTDDFIRMQCKMNGIDYPPKLKL